MNVLIVESPGNRQKLSTALESQWKVAASVGYIPDLSQHELSVALLESSTTYGLTKSGQGLVQKLRTLVTSADTVYLATDPAAKASPLLGTRKRSRAWTIRIAAPAPASIRLRYWQPSQVRAGSSCVWSFRRKPTWFAIASSATS